MPPEMGQKIGVLTIDYSLDVLRSPINIIATFVLFAAILTSVGFWVDKDYDIAKAVQFSIIFPITALTFVLKTHYYKSQLRGKTKLEIIMILFNAYVVTTLQFLALSLGTLDFIFTTAANNSQLIINSEAEAHANEIRSIMVLFVTLLVFPAFEKMIFWTMENRERLARALFQFMSKWFGY